MVRKLILVLGFVSFFPLALPVHADEIRFEGQGAILSDYIFRGISRTMGDPALQLNLDLVHDNGLYAGGFFTNFNDTFGHDAEAEFYVGYTTYAGAYDFNFTASFDSFHGNGDSTGYAELRASIARDFGLAYLSAGMAVSPDSREFGGGRSVYTYTAAELPLPFPDLPPMSLDFKVGYEDFAGGFNKWDWSAALYLDYAGLEWGIMYHDTDLTGVPGAMANVKFSLRKYF